MESHVKITDVVLRDGLQDEPRITSVEDRLLIAEALVLAGIDDIEAASFVNPERVPQMSGADDLGSLVADRPRVTWRALALNGRGIERAAQAGFTHINLVVSASSSHSQANAGKTPAEAIDDLAPVVGAHPELSFSGGIATAFVCPFDGDIAPETVIEIAESYVAIGVSRIGLADTLGTALPTAVQTGLEILRDSVPGVELSLHLHNADGQAFDTVDRALEIGIREFDAATGGYGGCPFAPGAHGNIATEDLVAHLHACGFETGIDLERLREAEYLTQQALKRGRPVSV